MVEARFTYGIKTSEKMVELVNIFYRSFPLNIARQDTPVRKAVTPNRRLAIT